MHCHYVYLRKINDTNVFFKDCLLFKKLPSDGDNSFFCCFSLHERSQGFRKLPVCSPDASEYVYAVRMRAVSKIRWKFFCSFETA
jgi:hypothetical protein